MKNLKIIGLTVSITFLMIIILALFIKAIGFLFDPWLKQNALVIAIVTGILLVIGVVTGTLNLRAMTSRNIPQ